MVDNKNYDIDNTLSVTNYIETKDIPFIYYLVLKWVFLQKPLIS